jgi:hypothetical protein
VKWLLVLGVVVACAGAARADDKPPAPAPAADDAWAAYDEAFIALAKGNPRADDMLRDLVDQYPNHPAAWRARLLLGRDLGSHDLKVAHAEFILSQSIYGLASGVELCVLTTCDSSEALLAAAGGIGLGFGISLYTADGMAEGETHLYDSGVVWGWWNAWAFTQITPDAETQAIALLGGEFVGVLGSAALWHAWHPTEGDVALANSFGFWGAILYTWFAIGNDSPTVHDAVIASDVAAILGGVVATRWHPSRGRTLMLDVGGVIGILAGGLATLVANNTSDTVVGFSLLGGTAAGLAVAAYGTRDWDARHDRLQLAPMALRAPASDRVGFGVGATLQF